METHKLLGCMATGHRPTLACYHRHAIWKWSACRLVAIAGLAIIAVVWTEVEQSLIETRRLETGGTDSEKAAAVVEAEVTWRMT